MDSTRWSDPTAGSDRPWGLSRARPFTGPAPLAAWRMDVDPETQIGRYFDPDGQPMPLMTSNRSGHASWDEYKTPTGTTNVGDGNPNRPPPEQIDSVNDQTTD